MSRLGDIERFYGLLDRLEMCVGGARTLADLSNYRDWPQRGVYFFFEPSEVRLESGTGPRVVRIGTHALTQGSRSTLRQRLAQHRGKASGGGNHRGSIFRLLVGQALLERGGRGRCKSWGVKGDLAKASAALDMGRQRLTKLEEPVEWAVSDYLGAMQFLYVSINDEPGPSSLRGVIERNAIALLSNLGRPALDPPSIGWLGDASDRPLVRESGLWNQRHVEETHDPTFLDVFEGLIEGMGRKH